MDSGSDNLARSVSPGGFLVVDRGNTRLKATYMPDDAGTLPDRGIRVMEYRPSDIESLMEWVDVLKREGPLSGAMAAVGSTDARLVESLRLAMGERFMMMTAATPLPIRIGYLSASTLGLDRKATACGAAAAWPCERVAVVDSGTALTIDLIDSDGSFSRGNISPGLQTRLTSLHMLTARLPALNVADLCNRRREEWGRDTSGAMWEGSLGGWIDETACRLLSASREGYGRAILTGGDSQLLMRHLPSALNALGGAEIKIDYDPHLLAKGMREIYRHHENEI